MTNYSNYTANDLQTVARHFTDMMNDFETFLQQLPAVARQFDGKVINKRFNDALAAASPVTHYADGTPVPVFRLTICKSYGSQEYDRIDLYVREKRCTLGGIAIRMDEHKIPTAGYVNGCGKRLDAAKFLEAVKELRNRMYVRVRTLQDMAAHRDEYHARLAAARQAFIEATAGIPDEIFPRDLDSVVPWSLTLARREEYTANLLATA